MTNGPRPILLPTVGSQKLSIRGLSARVACLVGLFILELIVLSIWIDTSALDGKTGLIGAVGDFGPRILQAIVVLAAVLLVFGYSKAKPMLAPISERLADTPPNWLFLAAHLAAMSTVVFLSMVLFGGAARADTAVALAWLAAGICGIATGVFFFIPHKFFFELARCGGSAWIYAFAAALATPVFAVPSQRLWKAATGITFNLVRFLISPLIPGLIAIPATRTIGSQKFNVEIATGCSGLEGMGLMLVFSILWLWFFRGDYKFPRALLLIPIGVSVMFLMNAVRIAVLILIGDAGAASVALGGFHSQAGWITFNCVALALASATHRVPWLSSRRTPVVVQHRLSEVAHAAFLAPFMAILAAAMLSRAASGAFEWLYPLRFAAAVGILWYFRRSYATINWRFGWAAASIGVVVFAFWIGLDGFAGTATTSPIPAGLAAMPPVARIMWLAFRILAAVVTVPIAEELAFRGFLLRRLISADFEAVSLQRWTLLAVLVSSIAFGLMHGDRWIAGSIAGLLYAGAQKWRGRIGDAVAAHGITNALVALWVVAGGHWSFW